MTKSALAAPTDLNEIRSLLRAQAPFIGERGGRSTGTEALDRLLAGGFPKGAITVLTGMWGAGRLTIAAHVAAEETNKCRPVAWIDAKGTLYPPALVNLGVRSNRMLIVRGAKERSVYATEQIISSGMFGVVVAIGLDGYLDNTKARRLQTATEGTDTTTLLVLDEKSSERFTNAAMKLRLTRRASSIYVQVEKDRTGAAGRNVTIPNTLSGLQVA